MSRLKETLLILLCLVGIAFAFFGRLAVDGYQAWAKSKCLEAGYTEVRNDYALTFYCVKRENQSDVVKRLSEVKK